jgi:polar amino acid transport system substrate-binding protein
MAWSGSADRFVPQAMFRILGLSIALLAFNLTSFAQSCGSSYTVKEGESLAGIAARVYGTSQQWTLIYQANKDRIGAKASVLAPGLRILIPCLENRPQAPRAEAPPPPPSFELKAATPSAAGDIDLSPHVRHLDFLTADDYPPFTGRSLPNGGLMAHLVSASMDLVKERSGGRFEYTISWINDWAAHLSPLLITKTFDAGFPWTKPDCTNPAELSQDARYRCLKFLFSDPVYEIFTVLFVNTSSAITFAREDEIIGKTLCLPAGASTYELDKGGRNWVRDNRILLLRPQTVEECFKLLDAGNVNAVAASDLTGKAIIEALGLGDRVKPLPRPLAIGTLHLIVPKNHPQAATVLYYINASLAKLRESGEYDKIVDSHLARYWAAQERK